VKSECVDGPCMQIRDSTHQSLSLFLKLACGCDSLLCVLSCRFVNPEKMYLVCGEASRRNYVHSGSRRSLPRRRLMYIHTRIAALSDATLSIISRSKPECLAVMLYYKTYQGCNHRPKQKNKRNIIIIIMTFGRDYWSDLEFSNH
jgi:hypothetical protein